MSNASMRSGGSGRSSDLLERAKGLGPRVVVLTALQSVPGEGLGGVGRGCLHQTSLRAPGRHPEADLGSPPLGQPLLEQFLLGRFDLDQDLARRVVLPIELSDDAPHELGIGQFLDSIDDGAQPSDESSLPDVEDLKCRLEVVSMECDEVEVLGAVGNHFLSEKGSTHVFDPVTVPGGELELLSLRRFPHADLEIGQHQVGVPPEEGSEPVDHLLVVLGGDGIDARAGAFLDVIEETRSSLGLLTAEERVRAGADREGAEELVEGLADGVGVGVRPEVLVALALGAPHDPGTGPFVAPGDGQVGIRLVVDELDVEARTMPLDQ